MPWRQRRHTPPRDIAAALPLAPGERVLAWTQTTDDRWHAASGHAFYIADGSRHRRVPWEQVDRAFWDRDAQRLVVLEVADFGQPQPRHELDVVEPGRLLEVVRERVTASVVMTRHVPVAGSRGLKVVARRAPAGAEEVQWSFWLDEGLEPDDPLVREAVERGLLEARAELGV